LFRPTFKKVSVGCDWFYCFSCLDCFCGSWLHITCGYGVWFLVTGWLCFGEEVGRGSFWSGL
jgi:hypothetical protein